MIGRMSVSFKKFVDQNVCACVCLLCFALVDRLFGLIGELYMLASVGPYTQVNTSWVFNMLLLLQFDNNCGCYWSLLAPIDL